MAKAPGFILPVIFAGLLFGCDSRPRQWDAFIYPDFEGAHDYETIRGFKSFELCRDAAQNRIQQLPEPSRAQYECGYKCEYRPGMDINICKETRD